MIANPCSAVVISDDLGDRVHHGFALAAADLRPYRLRSRGNGYFDVWRVTSSIRVFGSKRMFSIGVGLGECGHIRVVSTSSICQGGDSARDCCPELSYTWVFDL
jgi:hypothetical protein